MNKFLYLLLTSIPILFIGCDSEEDASLDKTIICSKLADALIANETDNASTAINNLLNSQGQINGLEKGLEKLKEQIDLCPTLKVIDYCFGCIETNPVQSEIRVTVSQNNQTISRAIDLSHSKNRLIFLAIHD